MCAAPPYLLATKLEAFADRGNRDYPGSRDFQDIVALADGREELAGEVEAAAEDVQRYLAPEVTRILTDPFCEDGSAGALRPDAASQARAEIIVQRLARISASGATA